MNPPFSLESWGYDDFTDGDPFDRFVYGMPPRNNGDYAWLQHVVKSLKPDGKAIVVMSQGVLFRGQPELTEEEDGRNKKADDEYLIRSGFLRDDLLEAVIVLPSGLFYGNNVPACLVVLNRRKPAARKGRVLMIWASRHYQHANPQSLLRRADCLRILLPWRAYGDPATALAILPREGQAVLDAIRRDREHGLREIAEAYDPALAPLQELRHEAEGLSAEGFKRWKASPDAAHPTWGRLAVALKEIDELEASLAAPLWADGEKRATKGRLKEKKVTLKVLMKEARQTAKARVKFVKARIKALERLAAEREERLGEVNRRADRETAEVNEATAGLRRICADRAEARRYFVVAEKEETEENEYNLNLPRYVDTFEPEEQIDLNAALRDLSAARDAAETARKRLLELLPIES
jgi:type I restriction enzyme M protein